MNATQTKTTPVPVPAGVPQRDPAAGPSGRGIVYRAAAWLSAAVFLFFTGAGIYCAFRTEGRPPRVNLNFIVEINKLLSGNDPDSYAQAVAQMRTAVTIDPQTRQALLEEMRRIAASRGDVDTEIFALRAQMKAVGSYPTPEMCVDLALAQLAKQRENVKNGEPSDALVEEARENCRKALEIHPTYAAAWYIIGEGWSMLGREQPAEQAFRDAARLLTTTDGGGTPSLVRLASAAEARRDRQTRVLALRKLALAQSGIDASAYNDLASALLDLQNERRNADEIAESIHWSQQAIRLDSNFAQSYCNLGAAFALLNQNAAAAENFRKACALDPNLEPARQGLAYVEQQLQNSGKAAQ